MWQFIVNNMEWIVLGIIAAFVIWGKIKIDKIDELSKETKEFSDEIKKAFEDGKITPEEFMSIVKEAKDVLNGLAKKGTSNK
jgi:uncharacterized membrane protein